MSEKFKPLQSVEIENAALTPQEKHKFLYIDLSTEISLEQGEPNAQQ